MVPTLGTRPEYLAHCIVSLRDVDAKVCFVAQQGWSPPEEALSLNHIVIWEASNLGAAGAINLGLRHLIQNYQCSFVSWIGDDDSIISPGFNRSLDIMRGSEDASASVGFCDYVDENGKFILQMRPRKTDLLFLNFKGSKLPQPGSILRSSALSNVGFLDESLHYAFDQDLFHRLAKHGSINIVRELVSTWRWHPSSLSSMGVKKALVESHEVRMRYGNFLERVLARIYFNLVRLQMAILPSHMPIRGKEYQPRRVPPTKSLVVESKNLKRATFRRNI